MASLVNESPISATQDRLIAPAGPKRILVADDNEVVRAVVRVLIETRTGLEICGEAVNGLDAVQQAKDLQPDLVLLDYRMPRLNGVEAASIIKKELPQVRIVLFTLYEQSISKATIAAAHIDMVLSKPDGVDSLLESIQALMATDRPV